MSSKVRMPSVKCIPSESVDHCACGIQNSSCQKPQKGVQTEMCPDGRQGKNTQPSHGQIQKRRNPFRTCNPERLQNDSANSHRPDGSQQNGPCFFLQHTEADRCVGTGDHDRDHHVVQLFEYSGFLLFQNNSMIYRARCIECAAGQQKYQHGNHSSGISKELRTHQQWTGAGHYQNKACKMCDGRAGFTYLQSNGCRESAETDFAPS